MIGKLLATMSTVEEDRVLCTVMQPGSYWKTDLVGPCLVGTIVDYPHGWSRECEIDRDRFGEAYDHFKNIETRYDKLCRKLGVERINTLIRNRILDNRVKKALKGVKHEQRETAECY